ncbi:MAG TPA: hypothetical protein DEQ28_08740 [Clostridiales bacterium]|nr:hypothetical protein [Clostridiales bacterium]
MSNSPLSFTKLEQWGWCPKLWYFRYVQKLPEIPSPAAERGRRWHEAVAEVVQAMAQGEPSLEVVRRHIALAPDPEEGQELERALAAFGSKWRPSPSAEVFVEEPFELDLGGGESLRMRLDLVEVDSESVCVTDFKTSWGRFEASGNRQLLLYSAAARRRWAVSSVEARLWFLRYSRAPASTFHSSLGLEAGALDWARGQVAQIREAMNLPEEVGFPATPSGKCDWCSYPVECLALQDDPPELVLLRVEQAAERLRAALKARVRDEGPVHAAGGVWNFWTYDRWQVQDATALEHILRDLEQDPGDYFSVVNKKLRALSGRVPGLADRLRADGIAVPRLEEYFAYRREDGA